MGLLAHAVIRTWGYRNYNRPFHSTIAVRRLKIESAVTRTLPGSVIVQQSALGLAIARNGLLDDPGGQFGPRRGLVPVQGFQIVAHELLVEARRADAQTP